MKDFQRDSGSASEFEEMLIRAGRADAIPKESRDQILLGLGVMSPLLSRELLPATKAAATAPKMLFLGLGASGLSAVALWAGVNLFQSQQPSPASTVASTQLAAAQVTAPGRSEETSAVAEPAVDARPITPERAKAARPAARAVGKAGKDDSLSRELAVIESARAALQSGAATQSLAALDRHSREFPNGALATEATVLRIEALAARGDRAAATRLGKAFLARSPNGTYARRVRSLIERPTVNSAKH